MLLASVLSIGLVAGCASGTQNATKPAEQPKTSAPAPAPAPAKEQIVNIYTARHYDVDKVLYENFKKSTGITVNVVEGKAEELIERIKREGDSTPADLFITVDGGILNNAKVSGVLQPVVSPTVEKQVPKQFRDKDNQWIGLSSRARVIVYSKERVKPEQLSTYEDLATDKWKGKLVVRSSTNLYNQSFLATYIALNGEQKAEEWAKGIKNNMAQEPKGGDRDQAKFIAAGIADVGIMNTYYIGQMLNSKDAEEKKAAEQVGLFFPATGVHLNVSGAGLTKHSKNKENAVKLIEYLTGEEAQALFSEQNFEFPVNEKAKKPALLQGWGTLKTMTVDFEKMGDNNKKAVEIMNKVGWK